MTEREQALEALEAATMERDLPRLSAEAFRQARERAFQAGLSVYVVREAAIYEVFPDHRSPRYVKPVASPVSIPVGTQASIF